MSEHSKPVTGNPSIRSATVGRPKIKRPTTIHDDGNPTDDLLFDAKRVFRFIEDERYLTAEALHQNIRDRIQNEPHSGKDVRSSKRKRSDDEQKAKTLQLMDENQDILEKMERRCLLFNKANQNIDVDADWTLAQDLFGVTTYYRHEIDGSMSVKLEGRVSDCSLFDQVAVMREFDLNRIWAPFVTSSRTIAHIDKLDIVGWFLIGLPNFGVMRDALFRAIGCDCIYEDGSILIVAQGIEDRPDDDDNDHSTNQSVKSASTLGSVDFDEEYAKILKEIREDPILDTLDLPPVPSRMGGGRLTIRSLAAKIHLESPTSATTNIVTNIDLNLHFLPQALIDFVMKRMCGTILYKMQGAAANISKDPITNLHAMKIREEKDFYKTFLLPKFEGVCKTRNWEMPSIAAFELSDAQLEMAEEFKARENEKSEMKSFKLLGHNDKEKNLEEYLKSSNGEVYNQGKFSASNGGPKVSTVDEDSDDISDISKSSNASSVWTSNPISNYIRQMEAKEQQRKRREIESSRRRAAARLQPKSLNEDAVLRLKELRKARDRRKAHKEIQLMKQNGYDPSSVERSISVEFDERNQKFIESNRRWKVSLPSHTFFTKIFVLQFLLVSLFCLLYLSTAFDKFIAVREGSFWVERKRDLATLVYLGFAGVVHSLFSYVALIYEFSNLQLGSIAGKRTRSFYSQYVHYFVGTASAGMVGFGVFKPGIDKLLRWMVWNAYSIMTAAKVLFLSITPDKVETTLLMLMDATFWTISYMQEEILKPTILGRCFLSITNVWLGKFVATGRFHLATYVDITIKQYEGDLDALPWREDAYFTTRALLSHSAFFLMILLILYNFAANRARKGIYVEDNTKTSNAVSSSDNFFQLRRAATV